MEHPVSQTANGKVYALRPCAGPPRHAQRITLFCFHVPRGSCNHSPAGTRGSGGGALWLQAIAHALITSYLTHLMC